jgi:hypothetical protein
MDSMVEDSVDTHQALATLASSFDSNDAITCGSDVGLLGRDRPPLESVRDREANNRLLSQQCHLGFWLLLPVLWPQALLAE